jgi:hypothetical protein
MEARSYLKAILASLHRRLRIVGRCPSLLSQLTAYGLKDCGSMFGND